MMDLRRLRRRSKRIGRAGESAAAAMLVYKGFSILARNCVTPNAEIDIIARDGATLVFVEVKTRYLRRGKTLSMMERPGQNLTDSQRKRLIRAARSYLRDLGSPALRYRFDVVEVILSFLGVRSIRHFSGAFGRETVFRKPDTPR